MKALLLATALLAAPSIAQMTPPPADPVPAPAPAEPMQTDPATTTAMPATMPESTAPTDTTAMPAPMTTPAPVFQQPKSVNEAFPPPPPKADYPWCSKTVTDSCKQRFDPK